MNHSTIVNMMRIATAVSEGSKDPKRKVGAIIVKPDGSPISWGYNGLARGLHDTQARLNDPETKLQLVVHAEANAVFNAARSGTSTLGGIMLATLFPCVNCANAIIQAGITEVICPDTKALEPRSKWSAAMDTSMELLLEAGVKLTLLR
jgi:dCMP deaminase